MILLHSLLKSMRKMAVKRITINTLNNLFNNNKVRLASTETAVQKITIRSLQRRRRNNFKMASWLLLIIPTSAFGLGTWQVFRKLEKDRYNEEFMKIIEQPPVDLPKNLEELEDMEYRKVRVRGKFDHSKEIYLGPRGKVEEDDKLIFSLLSKSSAGYLIVTPFKLSDRNLTILVNRGWVPADKKLPTFRPEGQITEEVELVGLVRFQNFKKLMGVNNMPEKNIWIYRDLDEMAEVTGAAPVFLDADRASTVPGGPVGGQTVVGLKNDHLSYIFTWYGLSIISGYMWYVYRLPKVRIIV